MTKATKRGLEALVGQKVLLLCANYFYTGKLVGVSDESAQLEKPAIVYETGPWDAKSYSDVQALPAEKWNVRLSMIESYGIGK
jgi:hypothetical protein